MLIFERLEKMNDLTFNEYAWRSRYTAIYPTKDQSDGWIYPTLGLTGEAGEVANTVKKIIRDEKGIPSSLDKEKVKGELGDVLWYISQLAHELDLSLEEIARGNLDNLFSRMERGKLQGSGDDR